VWNKKVFFKVHQLIFLQIFLILISACGGEKPELSHLSKTSNILAFGDSLTYGTGTSLDKSYPSILSRLTGINVINDGIPGEITEKGKRRLEKSLKKYKPDLVILCHGGNDLIQKLDLRKTKNNLEEMINMIQNSGSDVILLAVPKPGILLKPVPFYKELADKFRLPLEANVLSEVLSDNKEKSDPVHPNDLGYQQIALKIASLLVERKAIKQLNSLE